MLQNSKIIYIGGFELPDRNAAAQRVLGIAKGLKYIGYEVRFINALKGYQVNPQNKEYYGFSTYEFKRESDRDYLMSAQQL